MAQLVRAPGRRAGDPGSYHSPGENFSLKLLIIILLDTSLIKIIAEVTCYEFFIIDWGLINV